MSSHRSSTVSWKAYRVRLLPLRLQTASTSRSCSSCVRSWPVPVNVGPNAAISLMCMHRTNALLRIPDAALSFSTVSVGVGTELHAVSAHLRRGRHHLDVELAPVGRGRGA